MKRHNWALTIGVIGLALLLTAGSTGCKRNKKGPIDTNMTGTGTTATTGGATDGSQPGLTPEQLADMIFGEASDMHRVYFDYDSSALRDDARATLARSADVIKQIPGVIIQLAGHCDERGTQEYNLALGDRRATAVRDYLISLGIPANQLLTVSYGEEQPAATGSDESAWSQNRRVEFLKAQ